MLINGFAGLRTQIFDLLLATADMAPQADFVAVLTIAF